MIVRILAAASDDGVVALDDGSLPWRQTSDLKHFRALTEGCSLVVGRRTFDLLPRAMIDQGDRQFFVLSRRAYCAPDSDGSKRRYLDWALGQANDLHRYWASNVFVVNTVDRAVQHTGRRSVWCIGGPQTWDAAIDQACDVVLSRIHTTVGHGVRWVPRPVGGFENTETPRPVPDLEQAGFHLTKIERRVRGPGDDHEWSIEHWRRGH